MLFLDYPFCFCHHGCQRNRSVWSALLAGDCRPGVDFNWATLLAEGTDRQRSLIVFSLLKVVGQMAVTMAAA